jgi:hypothetical protein
MRLSWAGRVAFVVLAAGTVVLPSTAALAKSSVPFTDPRSTGSIAFCNAAGQNITHGSVYDKPFAYRSVASVAPPTMYQRTGRLETLFAFQPRKGIDPSAWNGDSLTASTPYTNPKVPMAEGSRRDLALSDILAEYPLAWDGLVQLRMFASAPNTGVDNTAYPTATIRVTGTTWTQLDPVTLPCNSGSATSPEDAFPSSDPIGLESPQPLYNETPGVVALSPGATPARTASASAGKSASGATTGVIVVASLGGLVVVGGGTAWWRRRSRGAT